MGLGKAGRPPGPDSGVRGSVWRSGAKEGFKQRGSDWEAIESPHAVRRRTGWGAREKAAPGAKTKVGGQLRYREMGGLGAGGRIHRAWPDSHGEDDSGGARAVGRCH